jgi:hypothetical protein
MREIDWIVVHDGVDEITAARRVQERQDREKPSLDKLYASGCGKRLI